MGKDYRVSAAAVARAMTRNTVLVVASSPCFPHGVIDDVTGIAAVCSQPCSVAVCHCTFFVNSGRTSRLQNIQMMSLRRECLMNTYLQI